MRKNKKAEKFANLMKEMNLHIHILNRIHSKRSTLRHIVVNLSTDKDKKRIIKAAREKQLASTRHHP